MLIIIGSTLGHSSFPKPNMASVAHNFIVVCSRLAWRALGRLACSMWAWCVRHRHWMNTISLQNTRQKTTETANQRNHRNILEKDYNNIVQWKSSDQEDSSAPWPLIWFKKLKVSWGHEKSVGEVTESRLWNLISQDDPQHWDSSVATYSTASTHSPLPYRRKNRCWRARPGLCRTLPCLAWQSSSARSSSLMRKLRRLEDLVSFESGKQI